MGWDDKRYFSMAKLRVYAPKDSLVTISQGGDVISTSKATDGKADFNLPGTAKYDVSVGDSKAVVLLSFGDVKTVTIGG